MNFLTLVLRRLLQRKLESVCTFKTLQFRVFRVSWDGRITRKIHNYHGWASTWSSRVNNISQAADDHAILLRLSL